MNFPVHSVNVFVTSPGWIFNFVKIISMFRHLSEPKSLIVYLGGGGGREEAFVFYSIEFEEFEVGVFAGGGIALANRSTSSSSFHWSLVSSIYSKIVPTILS